MNNQRGYTDVLYLVAVLVFILIALKITGVI